MPAVRTSDDLRVGTINPAQNPERLATSAPGSFAYPSGIRSIAEVQAAGNSASQRGRSARSSDASRESSLRDGRGVPGALEALGARAPCAPCDFAFDAVDGATSSPAGTLSTINSCAGNPR